MMPPKGANEAPKPEGAQTPLRPENFSKFSSQILLFSQFFKTKHQILTIFVANFAETQPNFVGISQITQKTLQNAENQKKPANKLEKS